MNNLAKREILDISLTQSSWTKWVKAGAVVAGGYVALKVTFGLLGLAWTVASYLFWPATITGLVYFTGKKYLNWWR